ncbi:MAG: hypothetical protein K1X33_09385 [Methanobacteriaceae archaeon]|nr:hypothetical protein [Methanobacteriaceae archaeon]
MKKLEVNQMQAVEGGVPTAKQIAGCTLLGMEAALAGGIEGPLVYAGCLLTFW